MLIREYQWMGICAVAVAGIMVLNPVISIASDVDEVVVLGSGYNVSEDEQQEPNIDYDEIWAQVDRDELRSFVDVEALKENIDKEAILKTIDLEVLDENIDEEALAIQVDNDVHPTDVINVQLPLLGQTSPFDFLIDPQNLLYATDAAKYGGGKVEEGAGLLFRNTEGEYMFSSKSDRLTIVNRSNVPVRLSIRASVKSSDGIEFVDSYSQLEGETPSIFMALADDDGIRSVITGYGEASIDVVLEAAPEGTYSFEWNEEQQKYDYKVTNEDAEFDSFSFCVVGDCNKEGKWLGLSANPQVSFSWNTEAVTPEKEKITAEEQQLLDEIDSMVREYLEMDEEKEEELTQEEAREGKILELRYQELLKLANDDYNALFEEELNKLVDEEVEKLANDLFEELKAKAIADYYDYYQDEEEEIIEISDSSDEEIKEKSEEEEQIQTDFEEAKAPEEGDEENESEKPEKEVVNTEDSDVPETSETTEEAESGEEIVTF